MRQFNPPYRLYSSGSLLELVMFLDMASSSPAEILPLELRRYFFVMDKNGHKIAWAVNVNKNCVTRLALLDPFCRFVKPEVIQK